MCCKKCLGAVRAGAKAAVEEDEETEREDERGVTKRPDLNELDVPEWQDWHWIQASYAWKPIRMYDVR
jgi:hypothetical protein